MAPGVLELCIKMQSKNRSPILCNTVNKQEAVSFSASLMGGHAAEEADMAISYHWCLRPSDFPRLVVLVTNLLPGYWKTMFDITLFSAMGPTPIGASRSLLPHLSDLGMKVFPMGRPCHFPLYL